MSNFVFPETTGLFGKASKSFIIAHKGKWIIFCLNLKLALMQPTTLVLKKEPLKNLLPNKGVLSADEHIIINSISISTSQAV